MDKSGCAQISGENLGKITPIFAKNRVDSARNFTIKSPDEKLVILAKCHNFGNFVMELVILASF